MTSPKGQPAIGTLQERSLHAKLKEVLEEPGDKFEVPVEGFVIDIVRGNLLIEIQTRNFSAIKNKLIKLLRTHKVRLVYPIAKEKWIVRETPDGTSVVSKRRSPKKGDFIDVFYELIRIPGLIKHHNFSIELILINEEEVRRRDGKGSWRRKGWSNIDRRLTDVVERKLFVSASDFLQLLPDNLPELFTNRGLADLARIPRRLAEKTTYCLRKMGVIEVEGKKGKALLFKII